LEHREVFQAHSKAAPLQAVGNGTSYTRATPFEDEDEDEYDAGLLPSKQIHQGRVQRRWTRDHAVPFPKTVVGQEIVDDSAGGLNYGQSPKTIPGIDMRLDVSNQPSGSHVA